MLQSIKKIGFAGLLFALVSGLAWADNAQLAGADAGAGLKAAECGAQAVGGKSFQRFAASGEVGLMSDSGLPVMGKDVVEAGCPTNCIMNMCPSPIMRCCNIYTHLPCL